MKMIYCDYKIVDKESTFVLKKVLEHIYLIQDAYGAMDLRREEVSEFMEYQVRRKLDKCFRWYKNNYGVELVDVEDDRDYEHNIAQICEAIRSWED